MDDELVEPTRHRLNVEDYHRMAHAGILTEDDRVELIDGELIDMSPIGSDHATTVNGLTRALVFAVGDRGIVSVQNPIRLDRHNEPQPDFVVWRPRKDNYRTLGTPGPQDALLVVEVADSSLRFDRRTKLPMYAVFRIAELWIVNLQDHVLEVHRDPVGDRFATVLQFREHDRVTLLMDPEIVVPLERIFD